jgi:type I restriction enzyme R subunit
MKGLMNWVRLHPWNISQKVQIVVEHYRQTVQPLLKGHAKAMVVVGSRLEAVRWQLAIDTYIGDRGYPLKTLVAFSGEVSDRESGPEPFRETSRDPNPLLKGRNIRETFKGDEFQILLVANKFHTGFDQPLLCGMHSDKRLAGIQAVQTLSRLNRCHPGKDKTYVLDFVNEPDDIPAAFKTYFTTAELSSATDPNLILNLKAKLDAQGFYEQFEVDRVVAVELDPAAKQSQLHAAVKPVAERLLVRFRTAKQSFRDASLTQDDKAPQAAKDVMDALSLFKTDISTYQRTYAFLSQIFNYGNTAFEKRFIFFKHLHRLLEFGREREGVDISRVVLTHHNLKLLGKQKMSLVEGEQPKLAPLTEAGSGAVQEKQLAYLHDIISKVNDLFKGELTQSDKLMYVNNVIKGKLLESEILMKQAANNSKEQFSASPDLKQEILNAFDAHSEMSSQALNSEEVQRGLREILIGPAKLYEALRTPGTGVTRDKTERVCNSN